MIEEVAAFEKFRIQTKQGCRIFVRVMKKPYSDAALQRWCKHWVPAITREVKGKVVLKEHAHLFPCTPGGVRGVEKYQP